MIQPHTIRALSDWLNSVRGFGKQYAHDVFCAVMTLVIVGVPLLYWSSK